VIRSKFDVIVLGGGAAGLMCAIEAGKRGRSVLVLERNQKIGEKIRISGGGRCNFTNTTVDHGHYISDNPDFCKSALARFTPEDFIARVRKYGISYHEKKLGQLFCDRSSRDIIAMLEKECHDSGVEIRVGCHVTNVYRSDRFCVATEKEGLESESLVIATGGLSIPKLGATDFGYRLAWQFGLNVIQTRPGLVPVMVDKKDVPFFMELSGVSLEVVCECSGRSFRENLLFTHRGLSGPAILQISSFWKAGDLISINLSPGLDLREFLVNKRQSVIGLPAALSQILPKKLAKQLCARYGWSRTISQSTSAEISSIASQLHEWKLRPDGTEGYAKAEVTVGGVDTAELSSKTMEARKVPGLFVIGEVVDVTGQLGGYNFQWAWSSGYAAGRYA
jgi:predicted Rossmann fold flavoprotein